MPAFSEQVEEGEEEEFRNQKHTRGSFSWLLGQPVEPFKGQPLHPHRRLPLMHKVQITENILKKSDAIAGCHDS